MYSFSKIERKTLQSHLETAMALHLELACIKLNETNVRLKNTEVELRNLQEKQRKLAQLNDTQKLVWKIGSFSKVMEKAKKGEQPKIESFPFYTEQYGYKTKIVLYPHGRSTGENAHLSIFYTCMKGEYDAILPWPMEKVFKVTIIDQQNVKTGNEEKLVHFWAHSLSCFKRPINDTSAPFYRGWDKFMSHNELRTRRYLVDDTLFIQVEVYSP